MMKKMIVLTLLAQGCGSHELLNQRKESENKGGYALGLPSSKSTAAIANIAVIDSTQMAWTTILSNSLKTSAASSLFMSGSIECGLYTQTKVGSKGGTKESSTSTASVKVRVLVDGKVAEPGIVTFCSRAQTLTATFQGLLSDASGALCLMNDPLTGALVLDQACLQPEEIELILSTMNANSFNFVAKSVGTGAHKIEFQAMIATSTSTTTGGTASAMATIGKGVVLIEQVRLRRGDTL